MGIGTKLKSLLPWTDPTPSPSPGFYTLTSFTPEGKPVKSNGERVYIQKPRPDVQALSVLKEFILGRLLTDQEFLTGRMRADMDDEAALANPYSQLAAVYACVRARAVPIAMVPLRVYEWKTNPKTGDKERHEVTEGPLAEVFFNPNPFSSRYNLVEGSEASMSLNGEFMWYLDRDDPTQAPRSMWQLPTQRVEPIPHPVTGLPTAWEYDPGSGKPKPVYELWQVVHGKRWSSTSYLRGQGDWEAASMAGNQDWDAQRYNRSFLKNSCDPGGQFEIPEGVNLTEKQEKRTLRHFQDRHLGPNKTNRPLLLDGGLKWNQNQIPHRDMRWLNQRKLNLEDIRLVFSVPKIALGMSDGVNHTTADTQERMYWNQTLFPEMALIEDALWNQFRFIEDGRFEVLFDRSVIKVLQKDIGEKTGAAKDLFAIGCPAQEINRVLDMGLEPWEGWDKSYLPINLVEAGTSQSMDDDATRAVGLLEERKTDLVQARGIHRLEDPEVAELRTAHPEMYQVEYPYTEEETRAWVDKYLQSVYRPTEEKFASKWSRWVQEHRVATLRKFKRETDWEGDPTKTMADLGWTVPEVPIPEGKDRAEYIHALVMALSIQDVKSLVFKQEGPTDWRDILPDADEWGEKLVNASRPVYEEGLLLGAAARAGDLEVAPIINQMREDLSLWIREVCTDEFFLASPRINAAIQRSLVEGSLLGETIDQLATRVKRVHNAAGNRAFTIARTEVGKAAEYGAYRESTESGLVEGHWWVPGGLNIRESHQSMRGQYAALGTPFVTGKNNMLMHPHDPVGIASEVINCKCVLRPRLKP